LTDFTNFSLVRLVGGRSKATRSSSTSFRMNRTAWTPPTTLRTRS